jgi:putative transposase
MKQSRSTEERIVAILREKEAGSKTEHVYRKHGIGSAGPHHSWQGRNDDQSNVTHEKT